MHSMTCLHSTVRVSASLARGKRAVLAIGTFVLILLALRPAWAQDA
jgi:hypothetical protein